ncbi:MAG: RNA polymerase sigma-70 factor (ECF subfamily), partial [Planctomycetota bacterium]
RKVPRLRRAHAWRGPDPRPLTPGKETSMKIQATEFDPIPTSPPDAFPILETPLAEADLASPDFRQLLHDQDEQALAALFDNYFGQVYSYVRRLVRDETLTEDLTQDVFFHVYRALPSYDPSRPFEPWMYTIAANKVRDHWRKRARRKTDQDRAIDGGLEEVLPSDAPSPDFNLQQSELTLAVQEAVEALPDSLAEAVRLRAFEGLSFEAIGERIQRNATAARKRYSRAINALREVAQPAWKTHVCQNC